MCKYIFFYGIRRPQNVHNLIHLEISPSGTPFYVSHNANDRSFASVSSARYFDHVVV